MKTATLIKALFEARTKTAQQIEKAEEAFDLWVVNRDRKKGDAFTFDLILHEADFEAPAQICKPFIDAGWKAEITQHTQTFVENWTHLLKVELHLDPTGKNGA